MTLCKCEMYLWSSLLHEVGCLHRRGGSARDNDYDTDGGRRGGAGGDGVGGASGINRGGAG